MQNQYCRSKLDNLKKKMLIKALKKPAAVTQILIDDDELPSQSIEADQVTIESYDDS